jgi:hypothetical protein
MGHLHSTLDPQRENGDHTTPGTDILQSVRMRPALTRDITPHLLCLSAQTRPDISGDFCWVILYALLSLAWLGLICLVAPFLI